MASSVWTVASIVNVDYCQCMAGTMSAQEAAGRLGVKVETLYAYVSRGALRSRRPAGSRQSVFDRDEVEALARRGRPRRTSRPSAVDFTIQTHLTSIDAHGLRFRGLDAVTLARTATFERVAELLWTGDLPDDPPTWQPADLDVPPTASVTDALRVAIALAPAADPLRGDLRPPAVVATARTLVATMVASVPAARPSSRPCAGTIAERLWGRLSPVRPTAELVAVLNAALVLLADHELAASTFAARVAASTRADPYAVVLAGLGPVAGPLHGGASRAVRRLLDEAARNGAPAALATAVELHGLVPGFGHRLYPGGDPRGTALLELLRETAGRRREMTVVDDVLGAVWRRFDIRPNVDAALGALAFVAGMPVDAGEAIFTIARSAGWIAHAIEEYDEAPVRFRPRAVYVPTTEPLGRADDSVIGPDR
jgi:citrate synthase